MNAGASWLPLLCTAGAAFAVAASCWAFVTLAGSGFARYRDRFTAQTRFNLRAMFMFVDPTKLFAWHLFLMMLAAMISWAVSGRVIAGVAAAAVAGAVPRSVLRFLRERRLNLLDQQLPDALLMLAGGLRAGGSLPQAIQQLAREARPPISQECDLVVREQRLGVALDVALENLGARVPLQSVTLAIAAMRIAAETGGGLAEALERCSHTLRSKLAMEGKIHALTAQGKLQAIVVGALPVFLMVVLDKLEHEAMAPLFSTRVGWATLAVIGALELGGVLLIRKIVAIDV